MDQPAQAAGMRFRPLLFLAGSHQLDDQKTRNFAYRVPDVTMMTHHQQRSQRLVCYRH
jgi:hypothetical protein